MRETKTVEQEITIIGKISIGTLKLKGQVAVGQKKPIPLVTIYGQVAGWKKVEDKLTGETHEPLLGAFEATVMHGDNKGKRVQSGVLYLPSGIHDTLLAAAKKLMDESDAIEFGVQINAVEATNKAGYSYEGVQVYKPEAAPDPIELLRSKIPALDALTGKSLSAPKK